MSSIKALKAGDVVLSFFILRKKEMRSKADSGDLYVSVELVDATGRIFGTIWNNPKRIYEAVQPGDIVKVAATVIDYHDRRHLKMEKLRKARDTDEYDLDQLIARVEKDVDALLAEVDTLIAGVGNVSLRKLLQSIFSDAGIRTQFAAAPGGKLWHHNYVGGLLEHTLAVTGIALTAASQYPGVRVDLLLAGGLLHDIGKIKTYDYKTLVEFTDEGRLLGHIVMGAQLVKDRIRELPEFPEQLETELLHLILSHQGKLEQASPVVPMTLEGLLLYYADELDSKANAFLRIRKREAGQSWSSYVNLMNQYFYFGPLTEERSRNA